MTNSPKVRLCREDIYAVGDKFLRLVAASVALGHVNPIGTIQDYIPRPDDDDPAGQLVWDVFTACQFNDYDGARGRVAEWVTSSGIDHIIAHLVAQDMAPNPLRPPTDMG